MNRRIFGLSALATLLSPLLSFGQWKTGSTDLLWDNKYGYYDGQKYLINIDYANINDSSTCRRDAYYVYLNGICVTDVDNPNGVNLHVQEADVKNGFIKCLACGNAMYVSREYYIHSDKIEIRLKGY